MPLGVLEDKYMLMPPGTARLDAKFNKGLLKAEEGTTLKTVGDIILVPQPSDSPNDPLNWPEAWKNGMICTLGIGVAVAYSLASMIKPGLPRLATQYQISLNTVSLRFLSTIYLSAGIGIFFFAAAASIWGKRMFLVVGQVFLIMTCAWGFWGRNLSSLTVMRVCQGLASAPLEALVTPVIADLFFVHQRGSKLGMWYMMIHGGVGFGHIMSGYVIKHQGVHATYLVMGSILLILMPFFILIVLETTYPRPASSWDSDESKFDENSEVGFDKPGGVPGQSPPKDSKTHLHEHLGSSSPHNSQFPASTEAKYTYRQQLSLFHGKFSSESFLKLLVRPLPLLLCPAVFYSAVINGFHEISLTGMNLLSINILKDPPYSLDPSQLGLIGIPGLLIGFIMAPVAGFLSDWTATFLARRNKGIFEPEFRLWLMIFSVPVSTASFIGYGIVTESKRALPWLLSFHTLQTISGSFGRQAASSYVLDCHPHDNNSAFVAINFTRTLFSLAVTSTFSGWLEAVGPGKLFTSLAIANLAVSFLTIPAHLYGKRFRSYIARRQHAT